MSPDRTPRAVQPGPRPLRRTLRVAVAGLVLPAALLAGSTGLPASSAQAPADSSAPQRVAADGNPLAGHRWGVYKGAADQAWPPYARSTGTNRALLAKIALRPKAKWFGRWISNGDITAKVRAYIANSTGGDPDVLTQMTMFRMVPWEHEACRRLPTAAEQASYKQWVNRAAAGIGGSRVALILQPDGPFALCAPHGSRLPSRLVGYAARKFSALPRTSVYIDGGVSDWPKDNPRKAADFLIPAGVRYARGFALNSTHYATTGDNIDFGTRLVAELRRRGVPGKALRDQHLVERAGLRLRVRARVAPGQREGLPDQDRAGVRDPGHPAHRRRGERPVAALGAAPGAREGARGRLPVVRPPLAVHAGRPVRPQPGARAGAHDPLVATAQAG